MAERLGDADAAGLEGGNWRIPFLGPTAKSFHGGQRHSAYCAVKGVVWLEVPKVTAGPERPRRWTPPLRRRNRKELELGNTRDP